MTAPALSIRALRKRYGSVVAVDGLDLEVAAGECFGLLGPNGAGKTTTIEICEGLTRPDEGDVVVLGQRWGADDRALRQRLGISLQETQLPDKVTVEETVRLFRSFFREPRPVAEVIAAVELGEKARTRVGQLSGGQKQRLALALALVADPDLFFLDEPTTGLDPQSRRQLWELIESFRTRGRTVVLTTHYMEEAERLCDRVAIVDHGRVIGEGTPRSLIATLGARFVVEFVVPDGVALPDGTLHTLPGVVSVRHENGRWRVQAAELHAVVPALLGQLDARGIPLLELSTHAPTLEDVFVSLTGRRLRDG